LGPEAIHISKQFLKGKYTEIKPDDVSLLVYSENHKMTRGHRRL
jgi:hypothetical protein